MHLLLLSATDPEISETATWLSNHSEGLNALKPKLLIGGIGQLQTAWALQNRIRLERPDLVIQAGIGGAPAKEDIGKVYAISSDKIADLGAMEKTGFNDIFEMGLENPDRFPFRNGKLINPYISLLDWTGLPVLDGVTVNEIKSSDTAGFQRNSVRVVESMEGAALHYVCLMEKVPFIQIRSISNMTGDRDKSRWKIKEALKSLHEELVVMIQKLEKANETLFRI
ncbi:MAG TPA: futalosine hydrolase [Puia sp.]|jgi:futalosine hydrolase